MTATDLDAGVRKRTAELSPGVTERSDRKAQESDLLDEGLLETFPASDPVSIFQPRRRPV